MSLARLQTRTRSSSAFTLVELMIVIAIVGILASLVAVGVMKSLEKAKAVAARLEISQIEAAVAAAKTKYGIDQIPQSLVLYDRLDVWEKSAGININNYPSIVAIYPVGTIAGASSWPTLNGQVLALDSLQFMKKIFGNNFMDFNNLTKYPGNYAAKWTLATDMPPSGTGPGNNFQQYPIWLRGDQVLWFLLGGVLSEDFSTSNTKPKYFFNGFIGANEDPTFQNPPINPVPNNRKVLPQSSKPKTPFFEFSTQQIIVNRSVSTDKKINNSPVPNLFPYYGDSYGTPILYFSSKYNYCDLPINSNLFASAATILWEGKLVGPFANSISSPPKYFNPRTFQIVTAGADKVFGTNAGSVFSAGSGDYAVGKDGYDDLSNFSSTPLGKKDE